MCKYVYFYFLMMYNSVIDKTNGKKMKLKEIEVGMAVIDKCGNEYEVYNIDYTNDILVVALKCIKHVKDIQVYDDIYFTAVNHIFWIYKSKKMAKKDGCKNMDVITVKSLKRKAKK